ncbi:MAG: hypothetical protein NT027_07210 [Proteobacteria bacterium]|nr:hypothetical protein [Pseudomonadota bacterium]
MKKIGSLAMTCLIVSCNAEPQFSGPQKKSFDETSKYKHSFTASTLLDGSYSMSKDGRYGADTVTMREQAPTIQTNNQIVRKEGQALNKQGHDAIFSKEEFDVSSAGLLDLLIVIDDSRSMVEEQNALSTKLGPLLSAVNDTNWQIAVISMSNPSVKVANLIRKTDLNIASKFAKAVVKQTDTTAMERGFPMAIEALSANWVRSGSALGVIVVSDEDNCGSDPGELARCNGVQGKNAAEMVEFLHSIRPVGQARVYGLVKPDAASCPSAAGVGTEYLKAVVATEGESGSICAADYSDTLTSISNNVNRIIKREFRLSGTPDMKEFIVAADGVPVTDPNAYRIVANKVTINTEMFKDAKKISFSYTHSAVPKFDKLAVPGTVYPGTLVVRYNEIVQPATAYNHVDDQDEILFTPMPPEDALVRVTWRENKELLKNFKLSGTEIREDTVEVFVNSVKQPATKYTYTKGEIQLTTAPADGSKIEFKYKTEGHKILTYPFAMSREPAQVKTFDAATQKEIAVSRNSNTLLFDRADIVAGRKINVAIDYGAKPSQLSLDLPDQAIPETIKVLLDGQDRGCVAGTPGSDSAVPLADLNHDLMSLNLAGSTIDVKCPDSMADYTKIDVTYQHETPRQYVFKVPDSVPVGDGINPTEWKVTVDGKETKKFKRIDREIEIEESEIGRTSKVDIETTYYTRIDP